MSTHIDHKTDQTGTVTLDFTNQTQVVEQGEGDITYEFASIIPGNAFFGWSTDVWNFGENDEYPTLKGVS